jgi:phospholipid-binding lipoprotein MlaA
MTSLRSFASHKALWLALRLTCLMAVGAAAPGLAAAAEDDWEGLNRKIFVFNDTLDGKILKPVAEGYVRVAPDPLQRGIGNLFDNLRTPATALNQFLQGKPRAGFSDVGRFLLNSTVGVVGLFDVASRAGLPKHDEDFGQTFRVWGLGPGRFVMLPFFGPATTTDTVGRVFDTFTNPVILVSPARDRYAIYAVDVLDTRADLLSIEGLISGDKYLFLRDAYLQRREYLASDGTDDEDPFMDEDWDDEDWEDEEYYDDVGD